MLNILKLKKKNVQSNTILEKKGDLVGEKRHYPSATKEWFNSVYAYNKNTPKLLPSADLSVLRIIRTYFNMFSLKLEKSIRAPRLRLWMRRLKTNRILVAKPEFKHTNDKVIITLYIYNRELLNYTTKINKIKGIAFLKTKAFFKKELAKIIKPRRNKNTLWGKRKYFFLKKIRYLKKISFLKKLSFLKRNRSFLNHIRLIKKMSFSFVEMAKNQNNILLEALKLEKLPTFEIKKVAFLSFLKGILVRIRLYLRYKKIIHLNKSKFNSIHIFPLKSFLEKVYKKKVEFNLVSLKDYHLNSDLLMQILAIKLRNRKNRVLKVIGASLRRVKLPFLRRLEYFAEIPKKNAMQNLIVRDYLKKTYLQKIPAFNRITKNTFEIKNLTLRKNKGDRLNTILNALYPKQYTMLPIPPLLKKKRRGKALAPVFAPSQTKELLFKERKLENTVLDSLKNKSISGIRIEASGRLTKRLIASRAIFKMRQIGTIRNINSSYKGISSVLLRGNLRSNLQFAKAKNKTRIGSFGLKGWVSSV